MKVKLAGGPLASEYREVPADSEHLELELPDGTRVIYRPWSHDPDDRSPIWLYSGVVFQTRSEGVEL